MVSKAQYSEAAHRLQEANLGGYISIVIGRSTSMPEEIFIKTIPTEAKEILTKNSELRIVPEVYTTRFNMTVSHKITAGMRRKLQMSEDKNAKY